MIHPQRTSAGRDRAEISVRVAVYPEEGEPEITEISASNPRSATVKFTRFVMEKVRESRGGVPEEAVREVIENLIHAGYRGVVVSVLEGGNKVRVSDRGPGIADKRRALEFGFSGATPETLSEIRGIGAGLGIARAAAEKRGGTITVEDNLGGGTVVTIAATSRKDADENAATRSGGEGRVGKRYPDGVPRLDISERQQRVLVTVLECGEVGPSTVAEMLEISVSTAYRDLLSLEENGLVVSDESGKRLISPLGRDYVEALIDTWVK
ncbi:ATP-binding protein [Rubrobacter xylanophilus]|nr:ATP-binding protein [Rubrobacter xylanophilus]